MSKFIFFNGAGISISAGLPDFRSSNGIFKLKLSEKSSSHDLFDASQVLQNRDNYLNWLKGMAKLYEMIADVKPTLFHHFLVRLNKMGKLQRVYSQNIDELEKRAGLKKDQIVLLHGTIHTVYCMQCKYNKEIVDCVETFKSGDSVTCPQCAKVAKERKSKGLRERAVGTLRPNVVLYNEGHPKGEDIAKMLKKDRKKQHTIVIIGTSLKVQGLRQAIKDIAIDNEVWLVNPDENFKIPSDLKPVITKILHLTADEFVNYMDTKVLKQSTMDSFFKKKAEKVENVKNEDPVDLERIEQAEEPKIRSKVIGLVIPKKI